MKHLKVKVILLLAFSAILFTACEQDALVTNTLEEVNEMQLENQPHSDFDLRTMGCQVPAGQEACTPVSESCSGANVEVCACTIKITVFNSSIRHITINDVDSGWNVVDQVCADWENPCEPGTYFFTVPVSGNYAVVFNYYSAFYCGSGSFYVEQSIGT